MNTFDLSLAAASPALDALALAAIALRDPETAQIDPPAAYGVSEVTTMTTTTASASKAGNLYPFVTKGQLKERLENDPAFRVEAMCIIHTLQTDWEQATKATKDQNRQGFMSSHAVNGSKVAEKAKAALRAPGGTMAMAMAALTPEDWKHVDAMAPRYTRQLAVYFRAKQIAENPALAETAKLFSAG